MSIKTEFSLLISFLLSIFFLASLFFCQGIDTKKPSMGVINAKIWTGNSDQPWAEAIAVAGDKIVAVGSTAEIQLLLNDNARIIDAEEMMITPGFIDAHVHFIEGGLRLASVQLRDAGTREEFVRRIREYAQHSEPGSWITGGDWDHSLWGGELPAAQWIDHLTPNNPVWINRLDGHMALANNLAMTKAGITADTPDIKGGTIVRDKNGNPTGIFKDNAMALIGQVVPEPTQQQKDSALFAAIEYVSQQGITSVHHMGSWEDVAIFERNYRQGKLKTRIFASVPISSWEKLHDRIQQQGTGNPWLRVGGLKGFADGSLGSHTAAFFEAYTDVPHDSGLMVNSTEDLYQWISDGDKVGLQAIIHAIGDRANHLILNIFERVARENGERDRRFRIEHAQHLSRSDIRRFGQLNVIASMQPYHAIDDGRWAERMIGAERIKTTYAFRSLIDAGATVAFGSDWYVAPPIPLLGIYAAVTRRTLDDKNPDGWVPEQKISVEEALRAYTIDAAFALFEEKIKGS
ncbi:MAG TPA: amidohydrolase, partial [bacterium]|nr:amidohydrolase [bacterium]